MSQRIELHGLTLLKGVAAFGIVGCHLFLSPITDAAKALLHFCDMNVAVFGAVSGYLLCRSYGDGSGKSLPQLLSRKCRRILPAYLFWTCAYLAITPLFQVYVKGTGVSSHFYVFSYWISAILFGGSSTHLWYLAWLLWWSCALLVFWRYAPRWVAGSAGMAVLSAVSLVYCVYSGSSWCMYGLRLLVFMALGAAVYGLRAWVERIPIWGVAVVVMLGLALHIVLPVHGYVRDWIATVPVLFLFSSPEWKPSCVGDGIGANSFGVYLVHPFLTMGFAMLCKRLFGVPTTGWVLVVDWVAVCVFASIFSIIVRRIRFLAWIVR